MGEKKPQRVAGVPIWGVFLLFLVVVFLLQTLGILPWNLWGTLWQFWPVLIIIIGLGILLRRYNVWLVSLVIFAILGSCLGIAIWQCGPPPPTGVVTKSYSKALGNMERAQIEINFIAGSIAIESLPSTSPNFVEVDSEIRNSNKSMHADFYRLGKVGRLNLSTERDNRRFWGESGIKWEVKLARNIPLTIKIESGASNVNLDLSELEVTELRLNINASTCKLKVPSSTGIALVYIEANAANLEVNIPDGVCARVRTNVHLSAFGIDEERFPKKGDYYISDDFWRAERRVELEIVCDVGRVTVE